MVKLPVSQLHEASAKTVRSMETPENGVRVQLKESSDLITFVSITLKPVDEHKNANPLCLSPLLRAKAVSSLSSLAPVHQSSLV
jgi:hypothetical protein